MINMTNRSHVYMRLAAVKLLLAHNSPCRSPLIFGALRLPQTHGVSEKSVTCCSGLDSGR